MQLAAISLIFILTAAISLVFLSKKSNKLWKIAEYTMLVMALIGIVVTVADIQLSKRNQSAGLALSNTLSARSSLIYRTEWVMNVCDVWWSDVLNQTNDQPPVCKKPHPTISNETCASSCRAAHLIGQHRNQNYSPAEGASAADGLYMNICYQGSIDIGICNFLARYRDTSKRYANLSIDTSYSNLFANKSVALWVQILFALVLGIQAGKIKRDFSR